MTFTDPELAHVGLSEADARGRNVKVKVLRWPYHENDRAHAERAVEGHVKVVTDEKGRILGASIVGEQAGELIQMWALAIAQKLRIKAMTSWISPYPTLAEINKRVAYRYYATAPTNPVVRKVIGLWPNWASPYPKERCARDMHERAEPSAPAVTAARRAVRQRIDGLRREWLRLGLPFKLLLLTAAFVMLAEVMIFVPSVANYRLAWLNDRLTAARLASLAADAVPGGEVPDELRSDLLRTAQVKAVALKRSGMRKLVLPPEMPMEIDAHFDVREDPEAPLLGSARGSRTSAMRWRCSSPRRPRAARHGPLGNGPDDFIEIVLPKPRCARR